MKFFNNINLDKNQIIDVVIHKSAADPLLPVDGQIYYNTTSSVLKYYNLALTSWLTLGTGSVADVLGGDGLTATNVGGTITLSANVDTSTIEIVGDIIRIKDLGVTTVKLANDAVTTQKIANNNVTTIKILDKNITFAKIQDVPTMTVIGRMTAGTGASSGIPVLDEDNMVSNSPTSLATQQSIKAYVDATVGGIGKLIGSVNATTATVYPGDGTTVKGDYWYVTVAGTILGESFNIGDVIIANQNAPNTSTKAHYITLETNRDQATTTVLGVIQLATSAEVNTGTDANKAVTPSTLNQRTATETRTGLIELATSPEALLGADTSRAITPSTLKAVMDANVGGYTTLVGDGTALGYTITHSLNTLSVSITLYEVSTGEMVFTKCTAATVNTVTLAFAKPPALDQFRIVIKK